MPPPLQKASERTLEKRRAILESLSPESRFYHLFNYVEGLCFFAKDKDGILLAANQRLVKLYGFQCEQDLIGHSDFDLLPVQMAEKYRRDDLMIMKTRNPTINLVELFLNSQGIPSWFLTTKLPMIDKDGQVLGIMGVIQSYEQYQKKLPSHADIQPAMDLIARNYCEKLSIQKLARLCDLSLRQFERKFRTYFNLSPREYIIKMRILDACALLRKNSRPIGDIALDLGFYDQSSFTRQFKKAIGLTPLQYQKQFL